MINCNNNDLGILQPLVNAYNGIDSRLPSVPYTGTLSLSNKQTKDESQSKWSHKNSKDQITNNIAVSNLNSTFTANPKTMSSSVNNQTFVSSADKRATQ